MPAALKLQDIVLSANRKSWRMLDSHADETDKGYHECRPKILKRDGYQCAYCGFKAPKFQELHHKNDDHNDDSEGNLVTVCCLCHICFHLGMAGVKNAGTIIWCPELSQADINHLARTVFVAVANKGKHEDSARHLYEALEARASVIEEEFGGGASNPGAVGQAFLEMSKEQYETRGQRLSGIRLLPKMSAFSKQIAYWQGDKAVYGAIKDSDWERVLPSDIPFSG